MSTTEHVITNIKVDLVVNTKDELRRIVFGLEKVSDDDGLPTWTIHFKLFRRDDKATPYGDARVSLDVVVDKELHGKAAATATNGLTATQAAFLAGPASSAALASQQPGGQPADAVIQRTLIKR
ncbi:MAG TPA: hypothetical protein VIN03_22455 [Roseateles sp.]